LITSHKNGYPFNWRFLDLEVALTIVTSEPLRPIHINFFQQKKKKNNGFISHQYFEDTICPKENAFAYTNNFKVNIHLFIYLKK
jgi:protocatechuate 3,4-dioxygenase beta subunit